jgi:hypothetical protein
VGPGRSVSAVGAGVIVSASVAWVRRSGGPCGNPCGSSGKASLVGSGRHDPWRTFRRHESRWILIVEGSGTSDKARFS